MSKPQLRNRHSGKRERAVSLTGLYSETYLPSGVTVDWVAVCEDLGFDEEEASYFLAKKVDGVLRADIASLFGWHPAQAARVRWRVDRKIAKARNSGRSSSRFVTQSGLSSNPIILETLPSGRGVWTIPHISHLEEEISRIRVKNISSSQCLRFKRQISAQEGVVLLPIDPASQAAELCGAGSGNELPQGENVEPTLENKLRTEKLRLDKIVLTAESAQVDIDRAALAKAKAEQVLLRAEEDALLGIDSKPPSAEVRKHLAATDQQLTEAQGRLAACRRAIAIQRGTVDALENEIAANSYARVQAEIAGPAEDLASLIDSFVVGVEDVHSILWRNNATDAACNGLVPTLSATWEDSDCGRHETRSVERSLRVQLYNVALQIIRDRAQYVEVAA